jgi:hypothetical protein
VSWQHKFYGASVGEYEYDMCALLSLLLKAAVAKTITEYDHTYVPDIRQTMRKSIILHTSYLSDLPVLI